MSTLQNKAGVTSRKASHIDYTPKPGSTDVLGIQAPGSVTISEVAQGVYHSNVQSAINDVYDFSMLPVGSVVITTDGVSPAGQAQLDAWEFSGTVTDPVIPTGSDTIVTMYGIPVTATVGDNAEEFTAKAKIAIQDFIAKKLAIDSVTDAPSSGSLLYISYRDNQKHVLPTYIDHGITFNTVTASPAKPGYGDWVRIGSQTITFDGATSPTILYYFKRIA